MPLLVMEWLYSTVCVENHLLKLKLALSMYMHSAKWKDDLRKRLVCNMYNNRFVCFFVVFVSFLTLTMVMTLTPVSLVSNQKTENFVFAQTWNDLALSRLVSQGSPYYGNKSAQ
jgi:hypothetical protein